MGGQHPFKECVEALRDLSRRIRKYKKGCDDLANDRITLDKLKRRDLKLDRAWQRAEDAAKALEFHMEYGGFDMDMAGVDPRQVATVRKRVEKLVFKIRQKMHLRNLLPPVDMFEE